MTYSSWSVVFGEQPTAAKWNELGINDAGFKNGTNIDDAAILTRHLANSAVTTKALKPSFIDSNFTPQGSRFTSTSTSYVDVPGCSMSYTSGSVAEKLLLWLSVKANGISTVTRVTLNVNGLDQTTTTLHDGSLYSDATLLTVVGVPASTALNIKVRARGSQVGNTFNVINDVADWMPKITGFAIAQ